MKEIMSTEKATVIITPQVASQISCLHNQCPKNTEWSGLLICKILEGTIEEPSKLKIQTEGIFPMDFGDATFTSFEGDERMFKLMEQFPQVDPLSDKKDDKYFISLCHSHHNMPTFFSGTDTTDLHDSAKKSKFHLSLIVNYACEPIAKIAIPTETEQTQVTWFNWKVKGFKLGTKERKREDKKEEACYIIDCQTVFQQEDWFVKTVKDLKAKKEEELKKKVSSYTPGGYYQGQSKFNFNNSKPPKDTKGNRIIGIGHYAEKTYKKVLACVDDLILLGVESNKGTTARKALEKVTEMLNAYETADYKKAIKHHFKEYWFWNNFCTTNIYDYDEEEVAYCVLRLLSFHENEWCTQHIVTAVNEYLDELEQITPVETVAVS